MQVYVQPRVVKATEYILGRIPESDPEETDECMPIAAYPFVSALDTNPMSPVPRESVDTIVERTGKKLRVVLFDGGSPSLTVSRTVHIDHKNITKSWKSQKQYAYIYIGNVVKNKPHQSLLLLLHQQQLTTIQQHTIVQT